MSFIKDLAAMPTKTNRIFLKKPILENGEFKKDEDGEIILEQTEVWVDLHTKGSKEFMFAFRKYLEKVKRNHAIMDDSEAKILEGGDKEFTNAMRRADEMTLDFVVECIMDWDASDKGFGVKYSDKKAYEYLSLENFKIVTSQIADVVTECFMQY